MPLHKKPTSEELEIKRKEALAKLEAEELETPEVPEEPETPPGTPETEESEETPETSEEEETPETPETPEVPETPEQPEKKPEESEEDYKKRYEDSSREGHILYSKSKKLTEVIEKAGDIAEPTEDELMEEYPEWEVMSDFEKKLAKKNMTNDRRFDAIGEATKEFKDMDAWNKKVDEFLIDPAVLADNPELEGKEDVFKVFATKETRRGADFKDLVSAFLYSEEKKPPIKNKGGMFPTGTGGLNDKPKPKSDLVSVEDARRIRISDYPKYLKLLKSGKIDLGAV